MLLIGTNLFGQSNFSSISGPTTVCTSSELDYLFKFNLYTNFMFRKCTLRVNGGVFIPSGQNILVSDYSQISFKIKWNGGTDGVIKATSQYSIYNGGYGSYPYTDYTESISMYVSVSGSTETLKIVNNLESAGSDFDINGVYPLSANIRATEYEWQVTGAGTIDPTLGSKGQSIKLIASGTPGQATISVRAKACNVWSGWVSKTVRVAAIAPIISIKGPISLMARNKYDYTLEGIPYTEWKATGDAFFSIIPKAPNIYVLNTNDQFRSATVYARGRIGSTWSEWTALQVYAGCPNFEINIKPVTTSGTFCMNTNELFEAVGPIAEEYTWSTTYTAGNNTIYTVTNSNSYSTVTPFSFSLYGPGYATFTVSVKAKYCSPNPIYKTSSKTYNAYFCIGSYYRLEENEVVSQNLGIYPNPIKKDSKFNIQLGEETYQKIKLLDHKGTLVKIWEGEYIGNYEIEYPNIEAGLYTVQLVGNHQTKTLKLMVEP